MEFLKKLWNKFWYPETTKLFAEIDKDPFPKGTAGGCNCNLPKFLGADLAECASEGHIHLIAYDEHGRIVDIVSTKVTK